MLAVGELYTVTRQVAPLICAPRSVVYCRRLPSKYGYFRLSLYVNTNKILTVNNALQICQMLYHRLELKTEAELLQ